MLTASLNLLLDVWLGECEKFFAPNNLEARLHARAIVHNQAEARQQMALA